MKNAILIFAALILASCGANLSHSCDELSSEISMIDFTSLNEDPFYETPVIHYMSNSAGGTSSVPGKVLISKNNFIIQMDSKIEIQQGLIIDKLTVPVQSIKKFKVKQSGESFSFLLGPTPMVFSCENSKEIGAIICKLQQASTL